MSASGVTAPPWPWAEMAGLTTEVQLLLNSRGEVIAVAPTGPRVLGFAREPVLGMRGHDFVHPSGRVLAEQFLQRVVANPGIVLQEKLPAFTRNGEQRWLLIRARNDLQDPRVRGIAAVYRDVTARHESETSARVQGALNDAFFNTVGVLVLVVDPEGRIVRFNRACERATGYAEAEVQGRPFQDVFLLDDDRASVVAELQRTLRGAASPGYENHWHTRDGGRIRIAWSSAVLNDDAGNAQYVIGTGVDVTEQRRTEASLASHLRFFRGLSRVDRISTAGVDFMNVVRATVEELLPLMAGDRSFVVQFFDDGSTGRLTIEAQSFREEAAPPLRQGDSLALTPELAHVLRELRQSDKVGVWHVGLVPPLIEAFLGAFRLQSLLLAPMRVRAGGDWFVGVSRIRHLPSWSDSELQLFSEISRRLGDTLSVHHLFRDARQSAAQFRELAETVPDIVWSADQQGAVHFFNQRWNQATGLSLADSVGWGWLRAIHPDDVAAVHESWLQSVRSGTAWEHSFRLQHGEGQTYHWQLARARPLLGDDGQPLRWFASLTDIDQQRQTEAALHASQQQLRQAQKMEAIGRLAGGVAHDFNNLLTAINGYADLLLSGDALQPDVRSQLEEIRGAGERAAQLTGQLLTFSRKQVLAPQRLDLVQIVRAMERLLLRLIGEQVQLETQLPSAPLWITADPIQIEQVLLNLAINARDAMPTGGRLSLGLRERDLTELEALALQIRAGAWAELVVTDTGRGMDEHTRQRVFEPFFTTKPPGQGTGLGLSTVYAILQQCGAAIEIESQPGKGARFRILFPLVGEEPTDAQPNIVPVYSPARGGTETILVVEDDEAVRRLVVQVLEGLGYNVRAVATPQQAQRQRAPIDLLLTDVVLAGQSGHELATRLWRRQPQLPVLFMSGYTDDEVFRRGVHDRRHAFLAKPFTPETLARKVREVLDQHGQRATVGGGAG